MKGTGPILLALTIVAATDTRALIFYSTGDPDHNTTAPTGLFANSGFDLQGFWGPVQGTPIGPHHFITANHVGGTIGQVFTFRGINYTTVNASKDPVSDLRIWEVSGSFPAFANLYSGPDETGADLVVNGRGAPRGSEVRVDTALKGWLWAGLDGRLRWGRNRVSELVNDDGQPTGDPPHLLRAAFDSGGVPDEVHLAVGDSGGGVFIKQSGVWSLAAINLSVDGPYNTTDTGAGFLAAIFDYGGLYQGGDGNWQLSIDLPTSQAGSFYATRIKPRLDWIQGILATAAPVLVASSDVEGPYAPVSGAMYDPTAKTIRIPVATGNLYFQLESSSALTISGVALENSDVTALTLVIQYQ